MRKISCVVAFTLAAGCAGTQKQSSKEMAQLKALEKQEAWQELYTRLGTVEPTERDEEWQALGEKAVVHLMDAIKPEEYRLDGTLATLDGVKQQYPTIGKSKVYREKRMEVGIKAYKATYSDYRHSGYDDPWLQSLKKFVADDPETAELPLAAAKMVSNLLVESTTIPLYVEAAQRQPGVACKDGALHNAVIETAGEGDVWRDELTKLVNDTCGADLQPAVAAAADKAQPDQRKGLCDLLKAKGTAPASCAKS